MTTTSTEPSTELIARAYAHPETLTPAERDVLTAWGARRGDLALCVTAQRTRPLDAMAKLHRETVWSTDPVTGQRVAHTVTTVLVPETRKHWFDAERAENVEMPEGPGWGPQAPGTNRVLDPAEQAYVKRIEDEQVRRGLDYSLYDATDAELRLYGRRRRKAARR